MVGRPAHPSAPSIFLSFEPLIGPGRVNAGVPAVWFLHIFWPMIVSSNSVVNILITRLCYYCILEELHDICIYRILWYLMQNIDGQVNTVDSSRLRANCICRGCPSTTCPMSIFTEEYNQRHCWLRVAGAKPSDAQPSAMVSARRRIMVLHLSATHIRILVCSFFLYFLSTKRWNLFLISHNDFDDNLLVYF